jgi:hypothetical protein
MYDFYRNQSPLPCPAEPGLRSYREPHCFFRTSYYSSMYAYVFPLILTYLIFGSKFYAHVFMFVTHDIFPPYLSLLALIILKLFDEYYKSLRVWVPG